MSYDDEYGTQSGDSHAGRSARRSDRGATGPKRATAGTATAILMLAAILGFSGGAIAGNSGGDDPPTDPSANTQAPDDADDDPDNSDGNADSASPEPGPSDIELTLASDKDGGEAALGESGCDGACLIDISGALDPPAGGITLHLERSTNGGESWDQVCDNCTGTTSDDGTFTTRYWSGVEGENRFRLAGTDADGQQIESNEIAVEVVGDDSDDEDDE